MIELNWEQNMRRREVEALEEIAKSAKEVEIRLNEIENAIDCIGE